MAETRQPSVELRSVAQRLKSWRYPEDLPEGLPPLRPVMDEAAAYMKAMETKAAAVLLDRLFSVLPRPADDALPFWLTMIGGYPDWAVAPAVESLMRTYRYGRPPLPADLLSVIDADPLFIRRRTMLARIRSAEMKQRHDAAPALPRPSRYAQRAISEALRRVAKPMPRAVPSEAEFQRARQAVLDQCQREGLMTEEATP